MLPPSTCGDIRCYGTVYSILLCALYGPVFVMVGLAISYFVIHNGTPTVLRPVSSDIPGVILIGSLTGIDNTQGRITIGWTIGARGLGYAVVNDNPATPDGDMGFLSRSAHILFDRQVVKSYNPALVVNRKAQSSSAFQFSWTGAVDGFTQLPANLPLTRQPRVPVYTVSVELRVVEPPTNASLPLANPGVFCLPAFVGWEVHSCSVTDVGTSVDPNVYIISLQVKVDRWKSLNEQAMAYIFVILSFVAFGMTWRNIAHVWTRVRPRSISDLLTMPLGIAGAAGAVRAIFPANSPFQLFTDEGFYYPLIVLLIWCAFVAALMTSASAIQLHDRLSKWARFCGRSHGEPGSPTTTKSSPASLERGLTTDVPAEQHTAKAPRFDGTSDSGMATMSRRLPAKHLSLPITLEERH